MMSESNKQQAVNKLTEIVANFTAMISGDAANLLI